jgi:hypothetical protein
VTHRDDSLHLTIGLHPPTRLDALRAALDACRDDVEFRRTLDPSGELPGGLLERLAGRLDPADVARREQRRFAAGRRAVLDDQLAQARAAAGLGPHDSVERRRTAVAALDGPVLVFDGKELRVPARAAAALAAAHDARGPFTAAELPGPLDEAGRTVLVRRLVREGFLRVIEP